MTISDTEIPPYEMDDVPDVRALPFPRRMRLICRMWASQQHATPFVVIVMYWLKYLIFFTGGWIFVSSFSTNYTGLTSIGDWAFTGIAFKKAIVWAMFYEVAGFGCSFGPMNARFKPPMGGFLHFLRPGTTKLSLFPGLPLFGGITRSGSDGSFAYATISGRSDMPVNFVSWYDSIRFANWLHNGQGSGDTETGGYTLLGGTPTPTNGLSITRNAGATWFLTSEDEWYKAAYYDPSTNSYFDYPTASNTAPIAEAPAGGGNSANYNLAVGDFTDVGAYISSDSPYGTFDQGGNAWEWNEALIGGSGRGLRGGSWFSSSLSLLASTRIIDDVLFETDETVDFRVATVPEPSTAVLAIVA
ncbi:MAG: DUF3556 domain-containing protein, partial [Myxococcales bacterium]|nr:DUF3556 domain-containing protein [Myxococcales bacterium]